MPPALVHRERLFLAGNQLGKTLAGGAEWAMHLTGRYPPLVGRQDFRQAGQDVGGGRDRGKHARQSATHPGRPTPAAGGLGHGPDTGRRHRHHHSRPRRAQRARRRRGRMAW